jgi:hypothetical protein
MFDLGFAIIGGFLGAFWIDIYRLTIEQRDLEQTIQSMETQITRQRDNIQKLEKTIYDEIRLR